jgi:ABC-type Zn uptake system ZnuABC Zn-binding protein ZnuA
MRAMLNWMIALMLTSLAPIMSAAEDSPATVLTGMQATFSLASALTQGTPIAVVNVPEDGREFALLKDYIERRASRLAPAFAGAAAVVSVTNALPGDPLFRFARAANIRIVDIDAALPWSYDTPGVALIESPVSNVSFAQDADVTDTATAPYFWLSISNSIRMADIVAHDLERLFPDSATHIADNLDNFKRALLDLRNDYQAKLIEAEHDTVFALTGDFVYLTNDMGLFVDGYFIKQDVRWTPEDLRNLTAYLSDRDIRVVIHKWLPSDEIQAAVRAAGARLVVLDTGDPGIVEGDTLARDGLQRILDRNLEAVVGALGQ